MAVVSPENVERFEAIMNKWGVEYSFLGEVTNSGAWSSSGTARSSWMLTPAPLRTTARPTSVLTHARVAG